MDFTAIIAAVDSTQVLAALTAVALAMMTVNVARWGYNKVIQWFDTQDDYSYYKDRGH